MEEKLRKLREFLAMDTELPFAEFEAFYRDVTRDLQENYGEMSQSDRIRAGYICEIIGGNAESRIRKNKTYAKPFRKMAAKSRFWQEAIQSRLRKEGVGDEEITALLEQA
ncbi:MAG: hypothetical protein LBL37_05930 [Gracilibacteraceae bacterium]|jgi:hypothetical protein|nr:hypothetical protein [Gracilibacteraceae bacterium]